MRVLGFRPCMDLDYRVSAFGGMASSEGHGLDSEYRVFGCRGIEVWDTPKL